MKLTFWDRFLISLAPEWTLKRLRARAAVDTFARHYEAATVGRRTSGWLRPSGDANSVNGIALAALRDNARDLLRNNSYAKRARSVVANNVVGWGIVPKPNGKDEQNNARALELWRMWAGTTECETERRHTFAGVQHLAMRTLFASGEVLIRKRPRRVSDGLAIPVQLQVLEPDYLDTSRSAASLPNGGWIIQGVEFDPLGRREAYWLFPEHPGSSLHSSPTSKRIPASDVLHVFLQDRPEEVRGVSWLGAAIVNLKDLDDYDDAEMMKQKVAACFAAFVTDTDGTGAAIGEQDEDDELVEQLQPGMISQLPPGKSITFGNPPQITSDSLPTRTLRRVAAGIGITYEDMTGDYSQVNFSSARMGRLVHQGNIREWQFNLLIPQLCEGVWQWAMEAAVVAGLLREVPRADWTAPPLPMIEPDKEGLALSRLVRNGAMTPSAMIREQGGDPEAHWQEYAADLALLDKLKIMLDSDPRKTSQAGLTQARTGVSDPNAAPAPALADANPQP